MNIGIIASGIALPRFALQSEHLKSAWGSSSKGDRAVCFHDEDAVTLGVQAALAAGGDGLPGIDGVVCASVSPPFAERSTAVQIAAACDGGELECQDLAGARRGGMGGLRAAFAAIASGDKKQVLVIATDTRHGEPRSAQEGSFGHGAAAFVVGTENPGAIIVGHAGAFSDYVEAYRIDGEKFVRSEGGRLERTEGVTRPATTAIRAALKRAGVSASDVRHFAFGSSDSSAAQAVAKACEFNKDTAVDCGLGSIGDLGSATVGWALAFALERAKPGDVIVAAAIGDGADAVVLRATEAIANARSRVSSRDLISALRPVPSYSRYLTWRGELGSAPDSPGVSAVLLHHDEPMLTRRIGYRCTACQLVAYPMAKLCGRCRSEKVESHRLARTGTVFTFTRDRLFPNVEPETAMLVIDLDGGGRIFVQGTDCEPSELEVGTKVELVYRKFHGASDLPSYYWKARPLTKKEPS